MSEAIEWIDPTGEALLLDVDWSVTGRFSPPSILEVQKTPGQSGARVLDVQHDVAKWSLAHWLDGVDEADLRVRLRDLSRRMDPRRGVGRVRVTSPVGDRREMYCRVTDGLGVDETLGSDAGITSQRLKQTFTGHDPYWYAVDDTVLSWSGGLTVATFFPFFPIHLTASESLVDELVTNDGDVETWPVWRFTGPLTGITAQNLTTGQSWSVAATVANPQTITVDTRPGAKTVTRDDGLNLFPGLSTASRLWALAPGPNQVRISIGGFEAQTAAQLTLRPRYLAP